MDLGRAIKQILMVCETVTRAEHDAVARSALSVRVCPRARATRMSALSRWAVCCITWGT